MQAANDNRQPIGASIRFSVEPRLVPVAKAARRLHLSAFEFEAKRAELLAYGFPPPCPVTGHYDLMAIDAWLDRQSGLASAPSAAIVEQEFERRLAAIG